MMYNQLLVVVWLLLALVWVIAAPKAKRRVAGSRTSGGWYRLVIFLFLVFVFSDSSVLTFFKTHRLIPLNDVTGIICVVLCAVGVAFAIWARVTLGTNWGAPMTIKEHRELVTGGPYQFVRHPIYSGALLGMFGTAIVGGTAWLVVFVFLVGYFTYCSLQEERQLAEDFPAEFAAYKARTKLLVPFVW